MCHTVISWYLHWQLLFVDVEQGLFQSWNGIGFYSFHHPHNALQPVDGWGTDDQCQPVKSVPIYPYVSVTHFANLVKALHFQWMVEGSNKLLLKGKNEKESQYCNCKTLEDAKCLVNPAFSSFSSNGAFMYSMKLIAS